MRKIYKIEGNNVLTGTIHVSGSKNAALPIICAAILVKGEVILHNVPDISDIRDLLSILKYLNIYVEYNKGKLVINSSNIKNKKIPTKLTNKFRASYYLLGTLINLFDEVEIGKTGGCQIGKRPIDQHVLGFSSLGYNFVDNNCSYILKKGDNSNNEVSFKINSLGASINVVLSSLYRKEEIHFYNVSVEPEFIDFVEFLKVCGFVIDFDINNKSLIIEPSSIKSQVSYHIMYDRMEAGSYAILGALVGKDLRIKNFDSYYLHFLLETFDKMDIKYSLENGNLLISAAKNIKAIDIEIDAFPNFTTDLQQILSILMIKANGISSIKDNLFPDRFSQLEEIGHKKVNYHITDRIIIIGEKEFYPGYYIGKDLRGSMALLIYCLTANGTSYLDPKHHLERGYCSFYEKLVSVGACIEMEEKDD